MTVFLSENLEVHPEGLSRDHVGTKSGLSPFSGKHGDLTEEQRVVLQACILESGITKLMEVVGRTNRTKFREAFLNPLLTMGLLKMTIPDKPQSSNQKYRLTNKGVVYCREESD